MAMSNSSWSYKLPYKTRTFVDIHDIRIYTCLCIYQILVPPSIVLGFVGFDCLFTNLAFHITAQFGVLSCMLREILDDSRGFQCNMKELVLRHYKLIRYALAVLSTLFIYCYIGECLIQESLNLNTAMYRYEWYNVSPINLKMVNICMLRMKKPQQLTAGKFFVLSLASFTDILKTSMGYLSLLRTLI
ncbi:odorant receptor 45b-like [Vespula pensylvanica]|uniref:odorant receptor 45b-like n=1 Tax=Vespula pensylvanica TaxID=30213 RepID=UPI001CBA22DD|nr:odorant receptor 45b-like [Vespula pensylvanica]